MINKKEWRELPKTEGVGEWENRQLPPWLLDIFINPMYEWDNSPSWSFLVTETLDDNIKNVRWVQAKKESGFSYSRLIKDYGLLEHFSHPSDLMISNYDGEYVWETTSKYEGFGGRAFTIVMEDNRKAFLHGPWFGLSDPEWVSIVTIKQSDRIRVPWYKNTGTFGYYIHRDLLFSAIFKLTDWKIALFDESDFELYRSEWGAPKSQIEDFRKIYGKIKQ